MVIVNQAFCSYGVRDIDLRVYEFRLGLPLFHVQSWEFVGKIGFEYSATEVFKYSNT